MTKSAVVDAVLFDMDGTLIDSTPGVLSAWERFSTDYNLGDHLKVAHETHGRRLYDTLREYCQIKDEETLQSEIDRFEDLVIQAGPVALPGAVELLDQLETLAPMRWTIVTSASNKHAPRAIQRAGLPTPKVGIVTSNDVMHGKPHPAPYLAGAQKCGIEPARCLVSEDALSGLKAGKAAGAVTLAVCTTTSRLVLLSSGTNPDFIVNDLTRVSTHLVEGRLEIIVDETE
jgi:HAD superfamily hydrolase (TIGR01509 family)